MCFQRFNGKQRRKKWGIRLLTRTLLRQVNDHSQLNLPTEFVPVLKLIFSFLFVSKFLPFTICLWLIRSMYVPCTQKLLTVQEKTYTQMNIFWRSFNSQNPWNTFYSNILLMFYWNFFCSLFEALRRHGSYVCSLFQNVRV